MKLIIDVNLAVRKKLYFLTVAATVKYYKKVRVTVQFTAIDKIGK